MERLGGHAKTIGMVFRIASAIWFIGLCAGALSWMLVALGPMAFLGVVWKPLLVGAIVVALPFLPVLLIAVYLGCQQRRQ
jgi:hypothetical protein